MSRTDYYNAGVPNEVLDYQVRLLGDYLIYIIPNIDTEYRRIKAEYDSLGADKEQLYKDKQLLTEDARYILEQVQNNEELFLYRSALIHLLEFYIETDAYGLYPGQHGLRTSGEKQLGAKWGASIDVLTFALKNDPVGSEYYQMLYNK